MLFPNLPVFSRTRGRRPSFEPTFDIMFVGVDGDRAGLCHPWKALCWRMLLRLPSVKDMTGLSRSTIYSWITAGRFPAPVMLGPRSVAWIKEEIEAWVNSRITESRKRDRPHSVP